MHKYLLIFCNLFIFSGLICSSDDALQYTMSTLDYAFAEAVRLDSLLVLRGYVKQGVDVNQLLGGTNPAVHVAIGKASIELFDIIVSAPHFKPNTRNKDGETPLIYVLKCAKDKKYPHDKVIFFIKRLLACEGIDLELAHNNEIALDSACRLHKDFVKLLVEGGAQKVKIIQGESWAAGVGDILFEHCGLRYCIRQKNMAGIMSQLKEDPNAVTHEGETALLYTLDLANHPEQYPPDFMEKVISLLIDHPKFDPNIVSKGGATALMAACFYVNKSPQIMLYAIHKLLSQPNIDPNVVDHEGQTALMQVFGLAIRPEYPQNLMEKVISLLIDHPKFEPNIARKDGLTALMAAAHFAHKSPQIMLYAIKKLLLMKKLDINYKMPGEDERCALDCLPMDMTFLPLFIERGAQVGINTFTRAKAASPAVFDFLIEHSDVAVLYAISMNDRVLFDRISDLPRFNPNAPNANGSFGALTFAFYQLKASANCDVHFREYVIKKLVKHSQITSQSLSYALQVAVSTGLSYVKLLLEAGCKASVTDYDIALREGAPGVLEYLKHCKQKVNEEIRNINGFPVLLIPAGEYTLEQLYNVYRTRKIKVEQVRQNVNGPSLFTIPAGEYTWEELEKAGKARRAIFEKEKAARNCAICSKPDCKSRCSLCKQVYYCCADHQKQHWPNHNKEMHQPKECAICHEIDERGRQEKCGHAFHKTCIDKWIATKGQGNANASIPCPVCTRPLE